MQYIALIVAVLLGASVSGCSSRQQALHSALERWHAMRPVCWGKSLVGDGPAFPIEMPRNSARAETLSILKALLEARLLEMEAGSYPFSKDRYLLTEAGNQAWTEHGFCAGIGRVVALDQITQGRHFDRPAVQVDYRWQVPNPPQWSLGLGFKGVDKAAEERLLLVMTEQGWEVLP